MTACLPLDPHPHLAAWRALLMLDAPPLRHWPLSDNPFAAEVATRPIGWTLAACGRHPRVSRPPRPCRQPRVDQDCATETP